MQADNGGHRAEPDKLRVALVITDLDVGGAERALVELALGLARDGGFEVRVWGLMPEATDSRRSLVPALCEAGIPVTLLDATSTWSALRVAGALANAWRAWRPDVVQTFLFHANILGRLAAWRAGVPHVVSGIRVAERRGRWRLLVDRWTDFLVNKHVCVSQSVAEFSRTRGRLPPEKLLVIPNGIDIGRYTDVGPIAAEELGIPGERRWITYVGRLDQQKGLDWLLAQAPSWLAMHPEHDLLLVGDGPERATLERLATALGHAERIHFVGWQTNVPGILAASDVLVLPSHWEGMPNVVLEAMASARPVLAADVEGVRELLADAVDQVATAGDATGWAERLARVLDNPELAAAFGARNRLGAAARFSLAAMVAAYAALYRTLACPENACSGRDLA